MNAVAALDYVRSTNRRHAVDVSNINIEAFFSYSLLLGFGKLVCFKSDFGSLEPISSGQPSLRNLLQLGTHHL